ncbi:MAG: RagB/SusD family nutrient uptake outer membrane protein, partial [Sediminibacterium sp.]|nr:RagB/SusD family nutrient uptake outer membrane protein [Sediminibacterium sp.]
MKIKINYLILVFSIFLISCEKEFLQIPESDLIAGDKALQTTGNCESLLLGAYATIERSGLILFNTVLADEVKKSEFYNAGTVHEWLFGASDVGIRDNYQLMPNYYAVIDRVNRVLKALPNSAKDNILTSNATDSLLKTKVKAEALFLRAFAHFELYRFFSNSSNANDLAMAYMEVPNLIGKFPRLKVSNYFEKLKADITVAKNSLPTITPTSGDKYRANLTALFGLEARVALYLKDYQTAKNAATSYISTLPLSSTATFSSIWTDVANSSGQHIVECAFIIPNIRLGSLFRGQSASATGNGIGQITWEPANKLRKSFDSSNDVRYNSFFKYESILANANRPSRIINKYSGTNYATTNENLANYKVFRTAEMYLIRAEANAELGDLAAATVDLNTLRKGRIKNYVDASFTDKNLLIDAIMLERYKELCYEGNRMFDLKRRNLPVERDDLDLPAPNTAKTLPAGNFRFLLPIYITEIQANPFIQQNLG